MKLPAPQQIKSAAMLAGIAAAGYVAWKTYQGSQAVVNAVKTDLNPASDKNLIYSALPQDGFIKRGGLDPVFKFLGL